MLHPLESSSPAKVYVGLLYKRCRFMRRKDYILMCMAGGRISPPLVDEISYKKSKRYYQGYRGLCIKMLPSCV